MKTLTVVGILAAFLAVGCADVPRGEMTWKPVVCWEGTAAIERVRCGRPDAADSGLQAVCVDQAGDVALIHFTDGVPRSEVIYRHGVELTGLVLFDLDRSIPGEEIYVGGYAGGEGREGTGGAVFQLGLYSDGTAVRRVYEGPAFVHSVERVEPRAAGEPGRLLVSTDLGEIHLLTPTPGTGSWDDRLLHKEPASAHPEVLKVRDVAFLNDRTGRPSHRALVALRTGRTLLLDLDDPGATRLIHEEKGGLSRVTADPDGGAYITGYFGRVLHFVPDGKGFRVDVIAREGEDSGLRGLVLGRYPLPRDRVANMVIVGFNRRCRAFVPRPGGFELVTLYVDTDRCHTIATADLVPGNDADELLVGGYSKRITMLVATPAGP